MTAAAQGTREWREQRVGKITASRVGPILGQSTFSNRKQVMREMLLEAQGDLSERDAPPLRWGREHEAKAAELYQALYATEELQECGLVEHPKYDWLAASPDRLFGDDGLVEIKCPYSLRNDVCPEFKPVAEVPQYWHQIQLQLHCTGRKVCHFFQWTPHDYDLQTIERDDTWLDQHFDELLNFIVEYQGRVEQLGEEEDPAWTRAVLDYIAADAEEKRAKADKEAAKKAMLEAMGPDRDREDDLISVVETKVKGAVDYKAIVAELVADDEQRAKLEEKHRKRASKQQRITIKKVKA